MSSSSLTWHDDTRRLGDLVPWPRNPRDIDAVQAERLRESLGEFDQPLPIAIGPDGEVYDGHQRLKAWIEERGPDFQVAVRVSSRALTEKEREKLTVMLHKGAVGGWDWEELATWDAGKLVDWGFSEEELGELFDGDGGEAVDDPGPQIDKAGELLEKWGVERGQVWQVGRHRIMCGDSTTGEDVGRLMGGEKAQLMFTDPPYNVAENSRNYARDGKTTSKTYGALADAEWDKGFDFNKVAPVLLKVLDGNCAVYVCTSQWLVQKVWEWMWEWSDFCSYCVWCKPNPTPSLSKRHWTWGTELIAYAVRGKHISNFPTNGHALNWWEINRRTHENDHPTEKPIEVCERAILFSSRPGALVCDLFLGSGTTLVACEQTGRTGYGMEIEPRYVAVSLERLTGMGLEARLVE